jgi:hypothetical protein
MIYSLYITQMRSGIPDRPVKRLWPQVNQAQANPVSDTVSLSTL